LGISNYSRYEKYIISLNKIKFIKIKIKQKQYEKFIIIICASLIIVCFSGCEIERKLVIIPKPEKLVMQSGTFLMTNPVKVFVNSDELQDIGKYISGLVKSSTGFDCNS